MTEPFMRILHIGGDTKDIGFGRYLKAKQMTQTLQELMKNIWRESAGVFARELAAQVLVDTGESMGSLQPLARATKTVINFRATKPQTRKKFSRTLQGHRTSKIRDFAQGVRLGDKAFDFDFTKTKYSFTFSIPVFQLLLHDRGTHNTPGHAVDASKRALKAQAAYVRKQYKKRVNDLFRVWLLTGKVNNKVLFSG